MKVDDLMKIYFSVGVLCSKVIPDQYAVSLSELERALDRPVDTVKPE